MTPALLADCVQLVDHLIKSSLKLNILGVGCIQLVFIIFKIEPKLHENVCYCGVFSYPS